MWKRDTFIGCGLAWKLGHRPNFAAAADAVKALPDYDDFDDYSELVDDLEELQLLTDLVCDALDGVVDYEKHQDILMACNWSKLSSGTVVVYTGNLGDDDAGDLANVMMGVTSVCADGRSDISLDQVEQLAGVEFF